MGNILFDDLDLTLEDHQQIKQNRINQIRRIFELFGNIEIIIPDYDKKHIFVLYTNEMGADYALDTLNDYDIRKSITQEIKNEMKEFQLPILNTPRPNFYIRWVKKKKNLSYRNSRWRRTHCNSRRRKYYGYRC